MWGRGGARRTCVAEIKIPAGANYLVVSGRGWRDAEAALCANGRPERAIALTRVGEDIRGAATISSDDEARLRLEAGEPPGALAIGVYARPYPSSRWRVVLPACLNSPGPAAADAIRRDVEDFAKICAGKPLATSLTEIAADCLSGPLNDASLQAAGVLLRHLAAHPMDRSAKLGALAAALCQKDSAL
jgi:hypothetical protein